MRKIILPLLALFIGGCQTWGPTWSEVSGQRYHYTIKDRWPAIIIAIGDKGVRTPPFKVEPGTYDIVVQSPSHDGYRGTEKVIKLALEPCKYYYIVAQFKGPIGPDWDPEVDYVDDIVGCRTDVAKK